MSEFNKTAILLFILCAALFVGSLGCGKKAPPMPPDEAFYHFKGN